MRGQNSDEQLSLIRFGCNTSKNECDGVVSVIGAALVAAADREGVALSEESKAASLTVVAKGAAAVSAIMAAVDDTLLQGNRAAFMCRMSHSAVNSSCASC